jgi:hypothetical protein
MVVKQANGQTQLDHHVLILCKERTEMSVERRVAERRMCTMMAFVRHIPARTVSASSWKAF